ncbi:SDR family oxidoreductase [Micromonospora sp. M12]
MSSNNGRTAIVTGASKGLGAGIATALAESGAAVVVNYRGCARCRAGGRGHHRQGRPGDRGPADVASSDDVRRLFGRAREVFGPVDVLVNNAAVATFAPLSSITEDEFQREMTTNLLGTILTTQALAAQDDIDAASIINVSTAGTLSHPPYASLYVASKGAVNAFTIVASRNWARAASVSTRSCPDRRTPTAPEPWAMSGRITRHRRLPPPLGRTGSPDDYGPLVAFLASDDARGSPGTSSSLLEACADAPTISPRVTAWPRRPARCRWGR